MQKYELNVSDWLHATLLLPVCFISICSKSSTESAAIATDEFDVEDDFWKSSTNNARITMMNNNAQNICKAFKINKLYVVLYYTLKWPKPWKRFSDVRF